MLCQICVVVEPGFSIHLLQSEERERFLITERNPRLCARLELQQLRALMTGK